MRKQLLKSQYTWLFTCSIEACTVEGIFVEVGAMKHFAKQQIYHVSIFTSKLTMNFRVSHTAHMLLHTVC